MNGKGPKENDEDEAEAEEREREAGDGTMTRTRRWGAGPDRPKRLESAVREPEPVQTIRGVLTSREC